MNATYSPKTAVQFFPWLKGKHAQRSIVRWIREGKLKAKTIATPKTNMVFYLIQEKDIRVFLKNRNVDRKT
jgi:hypothetical protein